MPKTNLTLTSFIIVSHLLNFIKGCQGNVRSDVDCSDWKSLGYCQQKVFVDYMKKNCCKACGVGRKISFCCNNKL